MLMENLNAHLTRHQPVRERSQEGKGPETQSPPSE